MKHILLMTFCMLLLAVAKIGQTTPAPLPALKVGDVAPDFTLTDTAGKRVTLSEFRGKQNVVLAFYVFAFTGG